MKPHSPLPARVALGIVAAMALSIPVGINLHDAHNLELLERTRQATDAQIIYKNCQNHGKVGYSYTVESKVYKGVGPSLDKPCDDMEVGESIKVFYSSEKPQISKSDLSQNWREQIFVHYFVLGVLSLMAALVIFEITRVDDDI